VTSEVLYRLHTLSQRYVRLHLQAAGRSKRAIREHSAIYRAWADEDGHETERRLCAHIEETRQELGEIFETPLS
jgi:DNA-binding GntR family transcriptional regulator